MMPPGATRKDAQDKPQSEKFIEKARELESNEDEGAFDEQLRKIAKPEKQSGDKDR